MPGATREPGVSTDEAEVITDGEEEEEDDDKDDGEKADLRGDDDEIVVVGTMDEGEGRGLLIDRSTGSVCVWKCRS